MPLFEYEKISVKGKRETHSIDADSLQDAKQKLLRMRVIALKISELEEKEIHTKLSQKELLSLTIEMRRLLNAGLPLYETLSALEEKYRGTKVHKLLLDLSDQVKGGKAFSQSLKRHSETFDLLYRAMIQNAERTGRLKESLGEISQLLDRQLKMKRELISAFLYPSLLALFCSVVLFSLLFFVIPSLKDLFEGRELHVFTRAVFSVSEFLIRMKVLFFVGFFSFLGSGLYFTLSKNGRKKSVEFLSKLPFLKGLFVKVSLARFCRAISTLLEGGVPVVEALFQARGVMTHASLERVLREAESRIREGESLYVSFQNHPLIPPLIPRMISIAEKGGSLSLMMRHLAEIYEDELEVYLARFSSLAQPVLLLLLGGIIGFVLLSVLMPLTDVSSFVS